jgi:hypothetical protein
LFSSSFRYISILHFYQKWHGLQNDSSDECYDNIHKKEFIMDSMKRRSGIDRRTGNERRSEKYRRQNKDQEYDGPNRRSIRDERSGKDRRNITQQPPAKSRWDEIKG